VELQDIPILIKKQKRYARKLQRRVGCNAVQFETLKMEAILQSRNTKHYKEHNMVAIKVGQYQITFNSQANWWFGVCIDSAFKLPIHCQKWITRDSVVEKYL
jgi:hypothetical protein